MPSRPYEIGTGPIPGLQLPWNAWSVLKRENIATLDELRAVADRLERIENIGVKTARVIRQELDRAASEEAQSSNEDASADRDRACCPLCGADPSPEVRAFGIDKRATRFRSHLRAHVRAVAYQLKSETWRPSQAVPITVPSSMPV